LLPPGYDYDNSVLINFTKQPQFSKLEKEIRYQVKLPPGSLKPHTAQPNTSQPS
jgi:hypothetical protein